MERIEYFSLAEHDGPYEAWPRETTLFCDGIDTQKKIPGFVIEAQYRWRDHFLVITSQDCPFEESNDFLVLDPAFNVVARCGLLVPYNSFLIENHWPISEDAICIHYYQELFFTLRITPPFHNGVFSCGLKLKKFENYESDERAMASLNKMRAQEEITKQARLGV